VYKDSGVGMAGIEQNKCFLLLITRVMMPASNNPLRMVDNKLRCCDEDSRTVFKNPEAAISEFE
jgi:hypothetical protein